MPRTATTKKTSAKKAGVKTNAIPAEDFIEVPEEEAPSADPPDAPEVDDSTEQEDPEADETEALKAGGPDEQDEPEPEQEETEPEETLFASIVAPIRGNEGGYASSSLSTRCLTPRQAAAARYLTDSLEAEGEEYDAGSRLQRVTSQVENSRAAGHTRAVRWLLDRYADLVEAEKGVKLASDMGYTF